MAIVKLFAFRYSIGEVVEDKYDYVSKITNYFISSLGEVGYYTQGRIMMEHEIIRRYQIVSEKEKPYLEELAEKTNNFSMTAGC